MTLKSTVQREMTGVIRGVHQKPVKPETRFTYSHSHNTLAFIAFRTEQNSQ